MLIPFGIKLFYVDLPAKIVHEVLVLPRTVKRVWQMCDGGRNFTLKMCHITYTRFRVGAWSGTIERLRPLSEYMSALKRESPSE